MSNAVLVAPYLLRVKNNESGWLSSCLLGEIKPSDSDFFTIMTQYLTSRLQNRVVDSIEKRSSKIREYTPDTKARTIDGFLQFGDYGYANDLENIETKEKKNRGVNDCEYQPLYFRIEIQPNTRVALLLLQRSGPHGCKTHFEDDLRDYIQSTISKDLNIQVLPYTDKEYIKSIIKGQVKCIRYIKNTIPSDLADALVTTKIAKQGKMELVFKIRDATVSSLVTGLGGLFTGKALKHGPLEINDVVYDSVKIDFEHNGRRKSVSLAKIDKITMDLDITSDIKRGIDGHPTVASLRDATQIIMDGIAVKLGWRRKP